MKNDLMSRSVGLNPRSFLGCSFLVDYRPLPPGGNHAVSLHASPRSACCSPPACMTNFHSLLQAKAPSPQSHIYPKPATLSIKPAHTHNKLLDPSAGPWSQLLFNLGVKFRDTLYYPYSVMNMTNVLCLKKMRQQLLCDSWWEYLPNSVRDVSSGRLLIVDSPG